MGNIHPNAVIEKGAQIGENVTVEAFAVIKSNVKIEKNAIIKSHAYIDGNTTIGEGTVIWPSKALVQRHKISNSMKKTYGHREKL
jgi:UDP-N-acetylglucosamine acyltransferase